MGVPVYKKRDFKEVGRLSIPLKEWSGGDEVHVHGKFLKRGGLKGAGWRLTLPKMSANTLDTFSCHDKRAEECWDWEWGEAMIDNEVFWRWEWLEEIVVGRKDEHDEVMWREK